MKLIAKIFSLVFFNLLLKICLAQEHPVLFDRVSLGNLNFGLITGITQDPQGYIWLASYTGLHRYDGYHDTRYSNDPGNPNSLCGNSLECVCADRNGIIWIGNNKVGLDRFDPETGIFTHYHPIPQDNSSLCSDTVWVITEDHEGILWIGTDKGLNRLDPKTGKFTRYVHDEKDSTSLSYDEVRAIYEDHQGILWIGTGEPWRITEPLKEKGGLNRFDRNTGVFKRYLHDQKDPQSLIDNRVRAIFEDSHGTFWVGTAGDGLHTMNRAKGIFERHIYDPAHPEKLSRPPLKKVFMDADDHITFITEDASGAIWIGTYGNGINRYDPITKIITRYGVGRDSTGGFTDKSGWWAFSSREGVLWISTWQNKLYKIDPLQNTIPHYATAAPVLAIQEDSKGMLWWGTTEGLFCKDHKNATVKHFIHDPHDPKSLSNDFIQVIYPDDQEKIWIGTLEGGLNSFNPKTQSFTSYKHDTENKSSLIENQVHAIFKDKGENLWIGTQAGLDQMNIETGSFIHYLHNLGDTNSLGNNWIQCIHKDAKFGLWIGCWNTGGIQLLNLQTGKFKHYLPGKSISSICEDSKGVIWVGCDFGLFRFDRSSDKYLPFLLPGTGMQTVNINYILEDNQKNLWASSSMGIIRINNERNAINIYNKNHGVDPINFLNNGYPVVCGKGHRGELFFADATGYYTFFPDQIKTNPIPPQIVLTGFRLGEKLIKPDINGPLTEPVSKIKEIRLGYNQNIFSFEFAAIHYSNPEDNRQIFMLENSDNDWRNGSGEQTAYYNNIPPGRYVFRVRAFNGDGAWTEKAISIIITPPWWQTWWFRILLGITITSAVYIFLKTRIRIVRRQEAEKSATQLKLATLETKALRSQMNPHFIFNALNAIKKFLLKNDIANADKYLGSFAKLQRLILENTRESKVLLENEIRLLELYLQLEHLRFEDRLTYEIETDKKINTKETEIPSMLIQPFVENAIVHGLQHKEGKGCVKISLWQKNGWLEVLVEDDGIGREKAALLSHSDMLPHKSLAVKISDERLLAIRKNKAIPSGINIIDLKNEQGEAAGTKVIICIPLE